MPSLVRTRRGPISYAAKGEGGAAFVFVHGNFATSRWWRHTLAQMPTTVRSFAPTLPGFAPNTQNHDVDSLAGLADDVAAFIEALELEQVTVVGHSLGGAIALELGARAPQRLASVCVVAPAPGDRLESLRGRSTPMGRAIRWLPPDSIAARTTLQALLFWGRAVGTTHRQMRDDLKKMMPGAPLSSFEFDELAGDAEVMPASTIVQVYRALADWDIHEVAPHVKVPVTILAGENDLMVPIELLRDMHGLLPNAELEVWPEGGHSPMLEQPERFAQWLLERSQPKKSAPRKKTG